MTRRSGVSPGKPPSASAKPDRAAAPLALVAGASSATGLGSARALRKAGARVWGLTSRRGDATLSSRDWQRIVDTPEEIGAWITRLNELAVEIERPAYLLLTNDQLVAEISRRRAELDTRYRLVLPSDAIVQTFLQKTRFYEWARPLGLPLPDSVQVYNDSDLRAALRDLAYPVIIKPTYRTSSWNRASPVRKCLTLASRRDFDDLRLDLFALEPAYIVSRYIEGPDSAVHFCLAYCGHAGEVTASFTGRKLLQYPTLTGSTAVCVDTRNGEIEELTKEVFRRSGFLGLGSLEVKYDGTGKAFITEPTVGRPNLQSYAAVEGGCNLHATAMAHALHPDGEPAPETRRRIWWMQEENFCELVALSGLPSIPWRLLGAELARIRRPTFAYWQWRDPAPALRLTDQFARRALNRLFGKGRKRK